MHEKEPAFNMLRATEAQCAHCLAWCTGKYRNTKSSPYPKQPGNGHTTALGNAKSKLSAI